VGYGRESWNGWPADGSLPPHVERYVEWVTMPTWERPADLKTRVAFAKSIGVAVARLGKWDKDSRVRKAVDKRCNELNLSPVRIQEVMNAVFRSATEGDMKAAGLFLQHADRLKPNRVVIEDRRIADLSDDELRAELGKLGLLAGMGDADGS